VEHRTPEPIAAVIASRVKAHRKRLGWSGDRLAEEMRRLDVRWTRGTVTKLETDRRDAVTVQELFALALALDVRPVDLLVDPAADEVPLTPAVTWPANRARAWLGERVVAVSVFPQVAAGSGAALSRPTRCRSAQWGHSTSSTTNPL